MCHKMWKFPRITWIVWFVFSLALNARTHGGRYNDDKDDDNRNDCD